MALPSKTKFDPKTLQVERWYDTPQIVVDGQQLSVEESQKLLKMIGKSLEDIPVYNKNVSVANASLNQVLQKAEQNHNYKQEIAYQDAYQKIYNTEMERFSPLIQKHLGRKPTGQDMDFLKGFVEKGVQPTQADFDSYLTSQPQSQQTDFGRYFKEEKQKGRSSEDILANNPYMQKTTTPPGSISTASVGREQAGIRFRDGLTDTQKNSITNMFRVRSEQNGTLNETDAKNYAYATGQANWQQFVGKTPQELGYAGSGQTPSVSGASETTTSTGGSQYDFQNYSDLPSEILNGDAFQSLSDEQKKLIYFTYKAQTATNEAAKIDAQKALDEAVKLADPYFRQQIRIAQDEIQRSVAGTQEDAATQTQRLQDRIKEIREDLTFNREDVSLEQQAEMAQQMRTNQQQLFNLQQSSAEAGLAFSSPRQEAESRLMAEQQGIAESTKRKYNRIQREMERQGQTGIRTSEQAMQDLQTLQQRNLTEVQRKGETTLGTANAPSVPGVTPMGGLTGTLEEQRQAQILNLQNALKERQNPFSFS